MILVNPGFPVSTIEAYTGVIPARPRDDLRDILSMPVSQWKERLENRFEESVFRRYPAIGVLKQGLYDAGAAYAAMSGSGSSVFGLFTSEPHNMGLPEKRVIYQGPLSPP